MTTDTLEVSGGDGSLRKSSAEAIASLRLLATCHAIVGGIGVIASIGLMMAEFDEPEVRGIAIALFVANIIFVASGLCMMNRKFRGLSLIAAIVTCLIFPSGTFLGIWTIVVLNNRGVEELYARRSAG